MGHIACISPSTLSFLFILLLLPGCRQVESPFGRPPATATLRTIWPSDDGRYWSYQIVMRDLNGGAVHYYSTADSVPTAPSLDEIERAIRARPVLAAVGSDTATFRLQFSGMVTTQSGAVGQNLTETVSRPTPALRTPVMRPGGSAFLAQLLRARPELRDRLAARVPSVRMELDALIPEHPTLFLFGYAWIRTSSWIGSYGDVDTLLAWKYLTANLTPGSEFTHQLVPSLATDVFLHGRILTPQNIVTPAGTFRHATVCLYLVDYGISQGRDEYGNPTGYSREYSYGTVTYVDGVGPVASYEQDLLSVGADSPGWYEKNLLLTSRGAGATAWSLWQR